jgi:hypothetical protein
MKQCTKCKEFKDLTEFHKSGRGKGGLLPRCKVCENKRTAAWGAANRERSNAIKDKYRYANQEKVAAQIKRWSKNNPGKKAAQVRKRQAAKIQRTPSWLTKEQLREMQGFYIEAARLTKETGIPHEVDHIIPLQGKIVSGLHVPWNLRVTTMKINRCNSNKLVSKT